MPDTLKPENKIDILKYLDIISRRKYLFLIICVLITSVIIAYSYTLEKKYESSATILVEREKVINPLMRGLTVTQSGAERLRTIRQLIVSRSRLTEVIRKLDLDLDLKTPLELENFIKTMRKAIDINIIGNNLYIISYEGAEPQTVKDVVNTICNIFIEENLKATRGAAHEAFEFIQTQLNVYKQKLDESENTLRIFKEKNLEQLPGRENVNIGKLENYNNLLAAAEIEFKEAELQKSLLLKQLSNEKPLILAFTSSNGSQFSDNMPVENQLAQLNSQLNSLLTKYTEKYPEIINLKAQITQVKQKLAKKDKVNDKNEKNNNVESVTEALNPIYQQLKEALGKINITINVTESRITEYKEKIEIFTKKVESVPKQEQALARLQRGYDVSLSIYKTLLNKLEEARISRELELRERGENFQIIDTAQLPLLPTKPDRPKLILVALALGLIAALALIYLLYYLDSSIGNLDEAKNYFKYPVLAGIPIITNDKDIKKKRRSNLIFFSTAGLFLVSVLGLFIKESMTRYLLVR